MKQRELYNHDLDFWKNIDTSNHAHVQDYALPSVRLPKIHLSFCSGLDTIELFLRILSYHSFNDEEQENFDAEIKGQRPSSIARLIELADAYNSTQAVHDTLKRCNYTLGRPKLPLTKFNSSVLKMNEERIRQSIFIASFVNERTIFQILTHALIVSGSKFWASGIESPDPDTPKWQYLPDGLEGILRAKHILPLLPLLDYSTLTSNRGTLLPPAMRPKHHHRFASTLPPGLRRH
jgi:hypothetical protein